jgi:hypothetical protein
MRIPHVSINPRRRQARGGLPAGPRAHRRCRRRRDYRPLSGGTSDPAWLADLATILLTGQNAPILQPHPARQQRHRDSKLKSAVGLELRARGINVELADDGGAVIVAPSPGDEP